MTTARQSLVFHQVDAFTERAFGGNPAVVYVLDDWLADETMQAIAAEHNLSETAFVVPGDASRHALRWFTPSVEVELCGHATLASAHVLLNEYDYETPLTFNTRFAGDLGIDRSDDGQLWLDLPARPGEPATQDIADLQTALGGHPSAWYVATNYMAVYDTAGEIAALEPDMRRLAEYSARTNLGFIATAPADEAGYDFVSRYFAPGHGVDEDPVTGSAHATLAPYWADRLGRSELVARQISRRGGTLVCRVVGDRVQIGGRAVTFASGQARMPTESCR